MTSTLLVGGVVYSTQDPFATALLVSGATIAWIGSDEAAAALAAGAREDDLQVVPLDGALVAPAFVDAAAHVVTLAGWLAGAGGVGAGAAGAGPVDAGAAGAGPVDADALRAVLWAAAAAGVAALHVVDAGPELGEQVEELGRDPSLPLVAACPGGLDGDGRSWCHRRALDPDLSDPATLSALLAARVTAVLGRTAAACRPLAGAASSGVPLALGSGAPAAGAARSAEGLRGHLDPWATVRDASHGPDPATRISSRAAFAAHTRGGWRAGPPTDVPQGRLAVGAPATLAVWRADELTVEVPDARVAAWSTDPRAGTPLLPRLGDDGPPAGGALPRCLLTLRDGVPLAAAGTDAFRGLRAG